MSFPSRFQENVKVLFASCGPALLKLAVAKAMSIRPDLPLMVVSEFEPPEGRWIRYEGSSKFVENVRSCRDKLKGKQVEIAIVVSQPRAPHRRLRTIAIFTGPRCLVILNENLDYFDIHPHSAGAIARHIFRRAADWLRPATFRKASVAQSDRSVKVLFASCAPGLLEAAVATALSIRPELPLVVVSERAPPAGRPAGGPGGEWIGYEVGSKFLESLPYFRDKLEGRQVELAIVVSQPRTPYRKLRLIGILAGPRCLVVMNENLDFFDVHPLAAAAVARYIFRRAANWIRPATLRKTPPSQIDRSAKALYASCTPALLEAAVAKAASIRPELPLTVVSEFAPPAGRWIRYSVGWQFLENVRYCRDRLRGKHVELAIVVLQPRVPYGKLRLIGFLTGPRCLVVMTENLDYFDVHPFSLPAMVRHVFWRIGNWIRFSARAGRLRMAPAKALSDLSRQVQRLRALRAYAAGFAMQWFRSRKESLTAATAVPASKRPRGISVVIPSRNGRDLLEAMLPAVLNQLESGEIVVVDDCSDDSSMDFLRRRFPAVIVLRNEEPLGFASAVNAGIRAARFSHICLLNNDMAVATGFFHHLRKAFDAEPGLYCASPQIFLKAGLPRHETGKSLVRSSPALSDFPIGCSLPIEGEDLTYVLYGSSGCSLFEAERLLLFNGLDESYQPAYVEDLDLGVRAWQQGWPTVFAAGAHVVHQHRASMSRWYSKDELEIAMARNWLLFLARTVRDRGVFAQYWRHAVARLSQSAIGGSVNARRALGEVGITGKWRARRQTAAVSDSEIFALCNGSVSVFPGAHSQSPRPVVLIASPYLPFPLAHGGAVRMYNLMRRAAANWKQVLISFVDVPGPVPMELRSICAEVITVHRAGGQRRHSTGRPDVVEEFDSPSFRGALRQTVRKWRPAIAQLEFTQLAQYQPDCAGARTVLAEHDITFDLYQQLLDGFDDEYLRRQLDRWSGFERNAWTAVDRVVTMSEKDKCMVKTGNAVAIPNGVDLEHFRPGPDPPEPGRLLFLGSFRHFPNLAGLDLFLKQVWPKVQPLGAHLHVVAGPDCRMWQAHYSERVLLDLAQPAVEVEEFVADVRPAYRRAEIVIVPLAASAGTNIKVLEALSMGKAIVTTTKCINGLNLISGDAVMVADTPEEFADAIAGLIQNRDRRKQLEVRARQVAEERFGWERSAAAQNAMYEELLQPGIGE
jgi:GT2 family glycosyltransferase/glycosyltransferase involved in cell wall biosynthesis